jgi:hypothetical protein
MFYPAHEQVNHVLGQDLLLEDGSGRESVALEIPFLSLVTVVRHLFIHMIALI